MRGRKRVCDADHGGRPARSKRDQIAQFVLIGVIHREEVTPAKAFLVCLDALLRIGKAVGDIPVGSALLP